MENTSARGIYHRLIAIPIWVYCLCALLFVAALIIVSGPGAKLVNEARAAQSSISMVGMTFSPATMTIAAGDTVTWTNNSSLQHTVTADDGSFDSGTINMGGTYSHTFTAPGTYRYYCRFHGAPGGVGMSGTIVVTASNQNSNPNTNTQPNTNTMQNQTMPNNMPNNMSAQTYTNPQTPSSSSYQQPQQQSYTPQNTQYYSNTGSNYNYNTAASSAYSYSSVPLYRRHICFYISYYYPYYYSYSYPQYQYTQTQYPQRYSYYSSNNYNQNYSQPQYSQMMYQQPYSYSNYSNQYSYPYSSQSSYQYPQNSYRYSWSYGGY